MKVARVRRCTRKKTKAPGSSRSCTQRGRMRNDAVEGRKGWRIQIYRQTKGVAFLFLQALGAFEGHIGS